MNKLIKKQKQGYMKEIQNGGGRKGCRLLDYIAAVLVFVVIAALGGCGVEKTDGSKIRDLAYEMVEEDAVPEELAEKISEKKAADFKLTYESDKFLYVVRGYGEQETGGYSIQILDFYLTQNAMVFDTNLIGPTKDEKKNAAPSFPYVVVRTKNLEKNVILQ